MKLIGIVAVAVAVVIALLMFATNALAQGQPAAFVYDIRTDNFRWDYPVDDPVTEFVLRCGPQRGGPYSLVVNIPNALARSFPIRGVITAQGEYACVIAASNGTLMSGWSNEVFFSAGASASTPGNLRLERATPAQKPEPPQVSPRQTPKPRS